MERINDETALSSFDNTPLEKSGFDGRNSTNTLPPPPLELTASNEISNLPPVIQAKRPYDQNHLNQMDQGNIKYQKSNLLLTVQNPLSPNGPDYFFLETGNARAGAWHILNGHQEQFQQPPYNIHSGDDLAKFLDGKLSSGDFSISNKKIQIEVDPDHFVDVAYGDNGFIVTAFPRSEGSQYNDPNDIDY